MHKLCALLLAGFLAACGQVVEVPPAHVGKILTKEGFRPDVVPPSKFRLAACMAYCDALVILEAADRGIKEEMNLFMPKDQLQLGFDVRATVSISNDQRTVDSIFARILFR